MWKNRLIFMLLLIIPVVLIGLPKDFFNTGPTICLFTLITGYHCMGCGMTRACMHLIHLDYTAAWHFNKFSYIVFPLLILAYMRLLYHFWVRK